MKKYVLLLLLLVTCIGASYSRLHDDDMGDVLKLSATPMGWHKEEYDYFHAAVYMELKVVITNVSTDTVRYMTWAGEEEAIFNVDGAGVSLVRRTVFGKHFPWCTTLPPNGTEQCTLYLSADLAALDRKFRLGMELISPLSRRFEDDADWDFLKRKPYTIIWTDDIYLYENGLLSFWLHIK